MEQRCNEWLTVFTRRTGNSSVSDIANTYAFPHGSMWFLLDTSCGSDRLKEIMNFTRKRPCSIILCTHYHNDHISNNGRLVTGKTRIIYHHNAKTKTGYLRTNSTGQILMMYREMDKAHLLKSLDLFSEKAVAVIAKRDRKSVV